MRRTALALLLLVASLQAAERPPIEVLIMATTDLHCQLLQDGRGGGMAGVASMVEKLRREIPAAVLVDVGDAFEGSAAADYYATVDTTTPHPLAALMNRIGYSAMALGNHDFTYGMGLLPRLAGRLTFPMLAANVASPSAAWQSHIVVQAGQARILLVGVTTPWTAASEGPWLSDVRFDDPVPLLRRLIAELRKREKPDIVCVLAHTGLGETTAPPGAENAGLCIARLVPGIDVLFLGHTHTTVNEMVGSTLVLQAGARGSHVATARMALERRGKGWRIVRRQGDVVAVDAPTDSAVAALCRDAEAPVNRWLTDEVGTLSLAVSAGDGALRLDGISHLIAEAMRGAGKGDVALVPLPPERQAISAGRVLRRDLYGLQPYLNRLVTMRLSAEELRACLEHSASTWAPYAFDGAPLPTPSEGCQRDLFLVADGISYVLDYTAPAGNRLAWIRRGGRSLPDSLDVVVSSYHATGAGGYAALQHAPVIGRTQSFLRDLLPEYMARAAQPGEAEERWWSIPTYRGSWAQPTLDMFLARCGDAGYACVDWAGMPSSGLARRLVSDAWGGSLPAALSAELEHVPLTRGRLLSAVVRALPEAACTPGSAAARFIDVLPGPHASVWDSVVSSGLVAFVPGERLQAEATVSATDLAAFVLHGRYRALTIASSNDFHGHLERNPKRGYGGIEAMAAWVAAARSANPEGVILLDAGDAMQGTPISNLFQGSSTMQLYRRLGYDALAVGNHDFDWGQDVLKARIIEAGFPFLGANVLVAGTDAPPSWLTPWITIDRGGVRTAVVGFGTPETPWVTLASNVAGLNFEEPGLILDRLYPEVVAVKPDVVVVLGHLGLEETDGQMVGGASLLTESAAGRSHVLFNGHTHQFYATTIKGLPHLQGGSYGRAYAVARVWVDRLGHDTPWVVSSLDRLDPEAMRHPEVAAAVEAYRSELAPRTEVVITDLTVPVSRTLNEAGESTMGRLIAESQRWMAGTPIAIMNTGGVRSDVEAGPLTWQELFTVQPFGNTLVKATLTGRELLTTLEQGIHPGGASLQLAGIEVWMNTSRAFGQRVVEARLEDGTPIDPKATYSLVVNNFMASGGDGFTVLRDSATKYDTGIADLDAMIAYLKAMPSPVTVNLPPRMHLSE